MLFNSPEFGYFFAAFVLAYYGVRNSCAARNGLIVVSSYIFYGWWDWRFLPLLIATSCFDFAMGLAVCSAKSPGRRKLFVAFSIAANLGVLGFFKYFGFFRETIENLLAIPGGANHWRYWQIVLPVGISFYTFQSMSYVIGIYRGQLEATRNPIQFLAYVSFFPQLVAGPIERAAHLLPQFGVKRTITTQKLEEGVWLVIWGLFKKVVVADNLAPLVELAYDHSAPTLPLIIAGTVAFALQIYGDFSGYSDIARGLASMLGFELMLNFNLPYFSTSAQAFWRSWHISLSTWFRDYLYVPLGGNRLGRLRTYLNLAVTMLLAGLWHGAGVTFVIWGLWQAFGLIVNRAWIDVTVNRRHFPNWIAWPLTMAFVLVGWVFFRAKSAEHLIVLWNGISSWSVPMWWNQYLINLSVFSLPLIAMEFWCFQQSNSLRPMTLARLPRAVLQAIGICCIAVFWRHDPASFIYFQF